MDALELSIISNSKELALPHEIQQLDCRDLMLMLKNVDEISFKKGFACIEKHQLILSPYHDKAIVQTTLTLDKESGFIASCWPPESINNPIIIKGLQDLHQHVEAAKSYARKILPEILRKNFDSVAVMFKEKEEVYFGEYSSYKKSSDCYKIKPMNSSWKLVFMVDGDGNLSFRKKDGEVPLFRHIAFDALLRLLDTAEAKRIKKLNAKPLNLSALKACRSDSVNIIRDLYLKLQEAQNELKLANDGIIKIFKKHQKEMSENPSQQQLQELLETQLALGVDTAIPFDDVKDQNLFKLTVNVKTHWGETISLAGWPQMTVTHLDSIMSSIQSILGFEDYERRIYLNNEEYSENTVLDSTSNIWVRFL